MNVPSFNEIWDEILSEKIIKKHKQYGNSLEEPALVFNGIMNNQLLIDVRIDDKLSRIKQLSNEDPKYWSEIKEIIAYLMWKLVLNMEKEKQISDDTECYEDEIAYYEDDIEYYEKLIHPNCKCIPGDLIERTNNNSGYKGDTFQSPQDTGEVRKRRISNVDIRGLPD